MADKYCENCGAKMRHRKKTLYSCLSCKKSWDNYTTEDDMKCTIPGHKRTKLVSEYDYCPNCDGEPENEND